MRPRAVIVWAWLDRFAGMHETAFPSVATLAKLAGCSSRDARRLLGELEAAGALHRTERPGKSVLYELDNPHPDAHLTIPNPGQSRPPTPDTSVRPPRTEVSAERESSNESQEREPSIAPPAPIETQVELSSTPDIQVSASELEASCGEDGCDKDLDHEGAHQNPWWDNLERVFGYSPSGNEASLWGRLVSKAKSAPPGEVLSRAQLYLVTWPNASLTPAAFEKHWDWLGSQVARMTVQDRERLTNRVTKEARRSAIEAAAQGMLEASIPER